MESRIEGVRLRWVTLEDAEVLTDLAFSSKAVWGYDDEFLPHLS